jgi:hypothetical protein
MRLAVDPRLHTVTTISALAGVPALARGVGALGDDLELERLELGERARSGAEIVQGRPRRGKPSSRRAETSTREP